MKGKERREEETEERRGNKRRKAQGKTGVIEVQASSVSWQTFTTNKEAEKCHVFVTIEILKKNEREIR